MDWLITPDTQRERKKYDDNDDSGGAFIVCDFTRMLILCNLTDSNMPGKRSVMQVGLWPSSWLDIMCWGQWSGALTWHHCAQTCPCPRRLSRAHFLSEIILPQLA